MDLYRYREASETKWTVVVYPNYVLVSARSRVAHVTPPSSRGQSVLWSYRSRMNMLRVLSQINWGECGKPCFVTLTYPDDDISWTYQRRTRDRSHFVLRVERELGIKLGVIWRTEFKTRQTGLYRGELAPHHHLLMVPYSGLTKGTVRCLWRAVLQSSDPNLQVDVRPLVGPEAGARYLAKYVAKYVPLDIDTHLNSGLTFGRQWGILRKNRFVWYVPEVGVFDGPVGAELCRYGDEVFSRDHSVECSGYTLFGKQYADDFREKFFGKWS